MGQKTLPIGQRLKINRTWDSRWFAQKEYATYLLEDLKSKEHIFKEFKSAGIGFIRIERPSNEKVVFNIGTARPGIMIGKGGKDIERVKAQVKKLCANKDVSFNISEIRKPEIDAKLVAEGIAQQLEKRVAFRRAMKRAIQSATRMGAKGIRVNVGGRLGGAEIARMEWYREGRVPLHTFRADIDYGTAEAYTTYGICGVKVWIYKRDVMTKDPYAQDFPDNNKRNK